MNEAERANKREEEANKRAEEKLIQSIRNVADKLGAETTAAAFSLPIEKVREMLK